MTNQSVIMAQAVKNPPEMEEMQVQPLGWEDPLEEEMATHSCILAWKTPGQTNLVGYCTWGCKELPQRLSTHTGTWPEINILVVLKR